MNKKSRKWMAVAVVAALALLGLACNGEVNKSASPVLLVVSNTQTIGQIDLAGGTGCSGTIGTINVQSILKNADSTSDQRFNDVRITEYRVSYMRTDGGKAVPASFVRAMDSLITTGGSAQALSNFLVIDSTALPQAPFAALLPSNGGRDPDTGLAVVKMNVIVDVYGETLAGERVSGTTRFPLDFCYNCGGCA